MPIDTLPDESMMNLRLLRLCVALLASLLCGCALGPDYHRPDIALTPSYRTAPASAPKPAPKPAPAPTSAAPQAPTAARVAKPVALETWWQGFDDPLLVRLVTQALAQNLDLEQARQRVVQSRAMAMAAGAALMPRSELQAGVSRVDQSLLSPIGALARHLPGFERDFTEQQVGVGASWEIDLFGGLRRRREAAVAQAAASEDQARAVQVSIAADTADAYLRMRELQTRLAVAHRQEQVQRELATLVAHRNERGFSSDRDRLLSEASLARVQATIPPLQARLDAECNRIDVLLGVQPGTLRREFDTVAPVPAAPVVATLSEPADLLRRRPDVLAAEQALVAANARIGASLAEYYPKLSLNALLGLDSVVPGHLVSTDAATGDLGLGLRWRLFDFGRVDAEVAQARGRDAELLAAYRATVLRAVEDVENALSLLMHDQARVAALDTEVGQLTQARRLAQRAFDGGAITLLDVRDTDRDLLTASDQAAQAHAGIALDTVRLFRALGGGWEVPRDGSE